MRAAEVLDAVVVAAAFAAAGCRKRGRKKMMIVMPCPLVEYSMAKCCKASLQTCLRAMV